VAATSASRRDLRVPAPQYWPAGRLPEGVTVAPPCVVDPARWARIEARSAEMDEQAARHAAHVAAEKTRRDAEAEARRIAWDQQHRANFPDACRIDHAAIAGNDAAPLAIAA
jgi:hypothetical protein